MLQEFWNYFMTTGRIEDYLSFKQYEEACQGIYKGHSGTEMR